MRYSSPFDADGVSVVDPPAQPRPVEGVHAGVDLVRLELLGRGVARLHDPLDRAELAADHAPELARIRGEDRGERDRGVVEPALLDDRDELLADHERHVARQDEDLARVIRERGKRRADGVAGPARDVLEREIGRGRRRRREPPRSRASTRRSGRPGAPVPSSSASAASHASST